MKTTFTYNRLDKNDVAVLLVDHQSGLVNLVQDFSPDDFKNNVLALADAAKYFKLPTILTTSFENGPNGPLVPELKELFPDAPYIARPVTFGTPSGRIGRVPTHLKPVTTSFTAVLLIDENG